MHHVQYDKKGGGRFMNLEQIDSRQFEERIRQDNETAIVVFTKETCKVCKRLAPHMEKIAADYENDDSLNFYEMNVLDPEVKVIFKSMQLVGVPQSVFFKDGTYFDALPGALDEKIIRKEIRDMINPKKSLGDKVKGLFGKK